MYVLVSRRFVPGMLLAHRRLTLSPSTLFLAVHRDSRIESLQYLLALSYLHSPLRHHDPHRVPLRFYHFPHFNLQRFRCRKTQRDRRYAPIPSLAPSDSFGSLSGTEIDRSTHPSDVKCTHGIEISVGGVVSSLSSRQSPPLLSPTPPLLGLEQRIADIEFNVRGFPMRTFRRQGISHVHNNLRHRDIISLACPSVLFPCSLLVLSISLISSLL